ncbi:hypothetical protein CBR_g23411 [Chara braunii]|uniref:CCHC-type domain-containing protein n=1 Tax=Chara braunii TaxID=69332 RepID=A0A388L450_CHABU|nr:hypothetical protein CBR_g23411 [Chara braunii]|eukprot:GBG77085.1 hypothetical protein CBR_g23411 [Chara braunii]
MSSRDQPERSDRDRERGDRSREVRDEGGERRPYRPPTCFAYNETGHYANYCPNRSRRYSSTRPSTSTDTRRSRSPRGYDGRREQPHQLDPELRSTIAKLGNNVSAMEEYYAVERLKKANKRKKKLKKEEEERRAEEKRGAREEERARTDKKALKAKQKKALEAVVRAAMQKDLNIQLAIQVGELENRIVDRMYQVVASVIPLSREHGKKKVTYGSEVGSSSASSGDGSDTSVTQELSAQTQRLAIFEKRKRGPEPEFEDPSPPMDPYEVSCACFGVDTINQRGVCSVAFS